MMRYILLIVFPIHIVIVALIWPKCVPLQTETELGKLHFAKQLQEMSIA
jgi:hypothetical protein